MRPIDIEALLAPISVESPAGEWLRYEGTYDRILEARREDDESLPQGVWKTKAKRADWNQVAELCITALTKRTKDLQIAAYLTEAWLQLDGPLGGVSGLKLCAELCQRFWSSIYPLLDGDDPGFRLAPLEWLDQKLPVKLKLLPLSAVPQAPGDSAQRQYCYADWERALRPGGNTPADSSSDRREGASLPTQEQIAKAVERTPAPALSELAGQLSELLTAAEELGKTVDTLLEDSTAALLQVRKLLEQMLGFLRPWSEQASQAVAAVEAVADGAQAAAAPAPEPVSKRGAMSITSRAEAYKLLDQVAEYLLRTEPHSPVGYLLKRAGHWGELPLTQLLVELVPEERNLASIYGLLGIGKAPNSD